MKLSQLIATCSLVLLLIVATVGTSYFVRAQQNSERDAQANLAKSDTPKVDNLSFNKDGFKTEPSNSTSSTLFEPLLLLLLGTILLAAVVGIQTIRSHRLGLPLNSATSATASLNRVASHSGQEPKR